MTRTEHLLTVLAEERAEVAQRVSKALRFGLDEVQPGQPYTNAQRVVLELNDLTAAVQMAVKAGALPELSTAEAAGRVQSKIAKVEAYLSFSVGRGLVDGAPADPTIPHPEANHRPQSNDENPDMECPQCKAVFPDLDGFGVLYCDRCKFCTHPSQSGKDGRWVCNCCDRVLEPLGPAIQG